MTFLVDMYETEVWEICTDSAYIDEIIANRGRDSGITHIFEYTDTDGKLKWKLFKDYGYFTQAWTQRDLNSNAKVTWSRRTKGLSWEAIRNRRQW